MKDIHKALDIMLELQKKGMVEEWSITSSETIIYLFKVDADIRTANISCSKALEIWDNILEERECYKKWLEETEREED